MYGAISARILPRLDQESLAERDFRVRIALEICGLLREYQECLFFVASSQPVFNRERFLRISPALYDNDSDASLHRVNSRCKRFVSMLIATQQFYQFLERLDAEDLSFFHAVMDTFEINKSENDYADPLPSLTALLQAMEDDIPTFRATKTNTIHHLSPQLSEPISTTQTSPQWIHSNNSFACTKSDVDESFVRNLLQPNVSDQDQDNSKTTSDSMIKNISIEDYQRITDTPWLYTKVFDITSALNDNDEKKKIVVELIRPLPLLQAVLGEEKYAEYEKLKEENKKLEDVNEMNESFDLNSLVVSENDHGVGYENGRKFDENKNTDLECIRLCILKAYEGGQETNDTKVINRRRSFQRRGSMFQVINFNDSGRQLVREAECSLRNPIAHKYLLNILSYRARFDIQQLRVKQYTSNSVSSSGRLVFAAFEVLIRLCHAMLEACREIEDYESAYQLLTHTTRFYTVSLDVNSKVSHIYMTEYISKHPIFTKVHLWEHVYLLRHQQENSSKDNNGNKSDYETAVLVLNEMRGFGLGINELTLFAARVSHFCDWKNDSPELSRDLLLRACDISRRKDEMYVSENYVSNYSENAEFRSFHTEWQTLTWTHPISRINRTSQIRSIQHTTSPSVIDPQGYYGRCMITSLASFGSSLIATGATDGSIFVANRFSFNNTQNFVQGVRLSCGPSQNPISCLTAVRRYAYEQIPFTHLDEHMPRLAGNYFVAGLTCGTICCWSLLDIYERYEQHHNYESLDLGGITSPLHEKKLTKHRGAVTCLDVPSPVYRPETIISGGKDGEIKLTIIQESKSSGQDNSNFFVRTAAQTRVSYDQSAPLITLMGHGGGITCLKSAWHGDRLLSGGEDATLRLWDIGNGGGKCILKMEDHNGYVGQDIYIIYLLFYIIDFHSISYYYISHRWVINASFWGENILVSSSTDRTVMIWDTRTGERPLMQLNYHQGPVSGLHVGSRSEAFLVTAGGEGLIATWDLRKLSKKSNGYRRPMASMEHNTKYAGHTHLLRGKGLYEKSVISCGCDGMLKEWDISTGSLVDEQSCGHDDLVSCMSTFDKHENMFTSTSDPLVSGGTITASWDGTVKLRRLVVSD